MLTHQDRAERRRYIARDLRKGVAIEEICDKYQVGSSTVEKVVREFGIKRNKIPNSRAFGILSDLLNTELTYSEIRKKYGITKQYVGEVFRLAKESGIQFPKHRL